ncbi:MAG: ABC transporter ATP-binding protein [Candidatus Bathyarchaeota archaeon]|nr:ABC transporter ATP-binding protein [Candidatus Bathyarchaeota archaeon]
MALKLVIDNLSFNYASFAVLKDINIKVDVGEVLSIVGPNGSGKSTLLKCINRILKPQRDTILIDGRCTTKISIKEMSKLMGYVPQSSISTFPFTVFDIVLMGRRPYINWNLSENDSRIAAEMLDFLGIGSLAMRHFNELSGGEQQKVVIARALAQQPQILLFDEPTSSLDIKHQLEILCILKSLAQNLSCSVVVSIHDLNLASRFSDTMVMLKKGRIFAVGSPEEVLTEENIAAVYDIKCKVTHSLLDKPQVVPLISEDRVVRSLNLPTQAPLPTQRL